MTPAWDCRRGSDVKTTVNARGKPRITLSRSGARKRQRSVRELLWVSSGGSDDESSSSSRFHDAGLRMRDGSLPRSRNEPRDYLRRGEGHDLQPARSSTQSHARNGPRRRSRVDGKSVIAVQPRNTLPNRNGRESPGASKRGPLAAVLFSPRRKTYRLVGLIEYSCRNQAFAFERLTFTSILRRRLSGSGLFE